MIMAAWPSGPKCQVHPQSLGQPKCPHLLPGTVSVESPAGSGARMRKKLVEHQTKKWLSFFFKNESLERWDNSMIEVLH